MKSRNFITKACKIAMYGVLIVFTLTACSGSDSNSIATDPLVTSTDKGAVRGVETDTTRNYYGIPYAAPPVGTLRWKAPQPVAAWNTARDATQFACHCPQADTAFGTSSNTSEDCLYLNVYRPKSGGSYPVMFYIHGGALAFGEGEDWDPTQLVEQGVVVVTTNYRLSALGFLAHPALSAEGGGTGNYGIMDQQAALRWVKTNIAAFGGNPNNVTIFGESAGGLSVSIHLVSPASAGLFHKAIIESGSFNLDNFPLPAVSQVKGRNFATAAGCTDQSAACLRSLPVATVLANQDLINNGGGLITPTLDNITLNQTLRAAFAAGNFSYVPMIIGSNHREGALIDAFWLDFSPIGCVTAAAGNYQTGLELMTSVYDARKTPAEVNAAYPVANYASLSEALDIMVGDSSFACGASSAVKLLSKYTTVYQYEHNDPNAPMIWLPSTATHPPWNSTHASELQYLFKVTAPITPPPFTARQQNLSVQMIGFWTQFAKTGNPNASGSTVWPAYSAATDAVLSLDPSGLHLLSPSFRVTHNCHFWYGD